MNLRSPHCLNDFTQKSTVVAVGSKVMLPTQLEPGSQVFKSFALCIGHSTDSVYIYVQVTCFKIQFRQVWERFESTPG